MNGIRVPQWFPQLHLIIELRPILLIRTSIMYESYELATTEICTLTVKVFNWSTRFGVLKRAEGGWR